MDKYIVCTIHPGDRITVVKSTNDSDEQKKLLKSLGGGGHVFCGTENPPVLLSKHGEMTDRQWKLLQSAINDGSHPALKGVPGTVPPETQELPKEVVVTKKERRAPATPTPAPIPAPAPAATATAKPDKQNGRAPKLYTYKGKSQSSNAWAREFGLSHAAIGKRVEIKGCTVEEAIAYYAAKVEFKKQVNEVPIVRKEPKPKPAKAAPKSSSDEFQELADEISVAGSLSKLLINARIGRDMLARIAMESA